MSFDRRTLLIAASVLISLLNLAYIGRWSYSAAETSQTRRVYSYRGHDFPSDLPLPGLDSLPLSRYTVKESEYYLAEGFPADEKWHALAGPSEGYIRLGPDPRIFAVTMFHQLHCLRMLNLAFTKSKVATPGHIGHCLSYLRQNALCGADLTLESGNFEERDFEVDRAGATHTCKQWSTVYSTMDANHDYWINHNTSYSKHW